MALTKAMNKAKPFLAVIFLQFGFAGLSIIVKSALNKGMNLHTFVVYRHMVAFAVIAPFALILERKARPKLTFPVFFEIMILGLLEPVIDQNLSFTGMKYTTATFTAAMFNILPAFAFLMAWICRLEKVRLRSLHSQAKIMGTLITIGGAMVMTLLRGPVLGVPWTKTSSHYESTSSHTTRQDPVKGAIMITSGCFCWAAFIILQAITLKSYPAELSLTALICLMGSLEGIIVAFAIERSNLAAWAIHFDVRLLAVVYGGVMISGIGFYLQGVVMQTRGPVFVTTFNPLSMVITAIMGSFFLHEILYLGRIIGAFVIVAGLYVVLWGKSKDQSSSSSGEKKTALEDQKDDRNGDVDQSSFVAIDLTKVRPTNEECV